MSKATCVQVQGEMAQICPPTKTELEEAYSELGGSPVSTNVGLPLQERDLEEGAMGRSCSLSPIQIHTSETLFGIEVTKYIHNATGMNLKDIMLSERNQTQKSLTE